MIKIATGWSNRGGSTIALINLTNELNKIGVETTLYGPHDWHLDKCQSDLIQNIVITQNDVLICHFLPLSDRPNAKKVLLSCHEKDLFQIGKIKQYWDEVIFLNETHRTYHVDYTGKFSIIPNLKSDLKPTNKTGLEKIAGIIGTFDENKQTHISIQRALADGCEKVFLFGEPNGAYYEKYVKPLCGENVIIMGFNENKQEIYNMIGCVYHSSKSEVACLVKDECYSTNTIFNGNENTNHEVSKLTNEDIIKEWLKIINEKN